MSTKVMSLGKYMSMFDSPSTDEKEKASVYATLEISLMQGWCRLSPSAQNILGIEAGRELELKEIFGLLQPNDRRQLLQKIRLTRETGASFSSEFSHDDKLWRISAPYWSDRRTVFVVKMLDVRTSDKDELSLEKNAGLIGGDLCLGTSFDLLDSDVLSLLNFAFPVAGFVWSPSNDKVRFFGEFRELTGRDFGTNCTTIDDYLSMVFPHDLDKVTESLELSQASDRSFDIEHRMIHVDGHNFYVRLVGKWVVNGGDKILKIIVLRELENAQQSAELQTVKDAALRERMSAQRILKLLTQHFRHDLGEVLAFLEWADNREDPYGSKSAMHINATKTCIKLANLLQDVTVLIDFASENDNRSSRVSLVESLSEIFYPFNIGMGAYSLQIEPHLDQITVDSQLFRQTLNHLAIYADKISDAIETVSAKKSSDHLHQDILTISLQYRLKESGSESQDRSADEELSFIFLNHFLQIIQGSIEVTQVDQRQILHCHLPVIFHSMNDGSTSERISLDGLKILLVDDSETLCSLIANLLASEACEMTYASDAHQALQELQMQKFDLLYLDINMPGMDGTTLCRKIRSEGLVPKETPIAALTAADYHEISHLQLFDSVINKPVSKEGLVRKTKEILCEKKSGEQNFFDARKLN